MDETAFKYGMINGICESATLDEKTGGGIENSDFMIGVLTPNSLKSPWVKDELDAGLVLEGTLFL